MRSTAALASVRTVRPTLIAAVLLLAFAALAAVAAAHDFRTADEAAHIIRGYAYLITRDARLDPDHPPLVNALSALPLLWIDDDWKVDLSERNPAWQAADKDAVRQQLRPYVNQPHALRLARLPIIGLGLLLGALVYRWAREAAGERAALAALFFYALCPNLLAHAHLSTTDVGMALGVFATTYAVWRYARRPSWARLLAVAAVGGLASMTKYSVLMTFVFLPPLAALLAALPDADRTRGRRALAGFLAVGLALALGWGAALVLFYGTQTRLIRDLEPSYGRWIEIVGAARAFVGGDGWLADQVDHVLNEVPLPAPYYFQGILVNVILHNARGHWSYLHGQVLSHGSPWYFPIAIAIKTPLPTLILLTLGGMRGARAIWRRLTTARAASLVLPASVLLAWLAPPLAFLAWLTQSQINLGLRHALMIYPFFYALVGATVAQLWRTRAGRALVIALVLWYVGANAFIFPNYLTYFNELIGGPRNGYLWLVDSNLDWGQERGEVKAYEAAHGIDLDENPGCSPRTGWIAVSARHLVGMMDGNPACYAWTEGYLVDRIGYTWFVFYIPE